MTFILPFGLGCSIIILIALLYVLIMRLRLLSNYRKEYLATRGTQHLTMMKSTLPNLQKRIKQLKSKITQQQAELDQILGKQQSDFEQYLGEQIVEKKLINVPGIGNSLRDDIITYCFDGSISSLLEAQHLRGIGPEKYYNIREFIAQTELDVSKKITTHFPGRANIEAKYETRIKTLRNFINKLSSELRPLERLHTIANDEKSKLETIKVMDFVKASKGNSDASQRVTEFINGVFTEWEKMPDWFRTLVGEFGE
jgi:hypothetical protein